MRALDVVRSYDAHVPLFLHNRPPKFIKHCLKRLPPEVQIPPQDIADVGSGTFAVHSTTEDLSYRVHVTSADTVTAPWCDCVDWSRHHLPCKHLLAVMTQVPQWGWDKLPQEYRSLPVFTLDPDLLEDVRRCCHRPATQPTASSTETTPAAQDPAAADDTHTATTTTAHCIASLQSKIRSALSTITSLSYRVTDEDCLRHKTDALTALVRDMEPHASITAPFLQPVQRRKKFVSAGSALRRRLSAMRRRKQLRKRRWTQRAANVDIGKKLTPLFLLVENNGIVCPNTDTALCNLAQPES